MTEKNHYQLCGICQKGFLAEKLNECSRCGIFICDNCHFDHYLDKWDAHLCINCYLMNERYIESELFDDRILRNCYSCGEPLNFFHALDCSNMEKQEFIKLWEHPSIEFFCCNCFDDKHYNLKHLIQKRIIFLIGMPGSGKSTFAEKFKDQKEYVIISPDYYRHEFFECGYDPKKEPKVMQMALFSLEKALEKGKNVIIDSTNLTFTKRQHYHDVLDSYHVKKKAIILDTPFNVCFERNSRRDDARRVKTEHVNRMHREFNDFMNHHETILQAEGFESIKIISYEKQQDRSAIKREIKRGKLLTAICGFLAPHFFVKFHDF